MCIYIYIYTYIYNGNARGPGSIPEAGRSPGEGISYPLQYSWASLVTQMVRNLPAMWETWVRSWVKKIPWRRAWQPTPVFSSGESPLTGEPGGHKESDTTEQLSTQHTHYIYLSDTELASSTYKEAFQLNDKSTNGCILKHRQNIWTEPHKRRYAITNTIWNILNIISHQGNAK